MIYNLVKTKNSLPSKQEIKDFIRTSPEPIKLRKIARVFGVNARDRSALRQLLVDIGNSPNDWKFTEENSDIPELCIMEITSIDTDGIAIAKLVDRSLKNTKFQAEINTSSKRGRSPILGDHILARIKNKQDVRITAELIRILPKNKMQSYVYGRAFKSKSAWYIENAEKGMQRPIQLEIGDQKELEDGILIKAELKKTSDRYLKKAKLVDTYGNIENPKSILAMTIDEFNLVEKFSDEALKQACNTKPISFAQREDLTAIPLITIDGVDAKDFDDAVFAEPTAGNGWRVIIAIADVSHYVHEDTALDAEAKKRGNSVYLPGRVLPMLPEKLSNDLCSLKPNEKRACLAVEIHLDAMGNKTKHRFIRGIIKSIARLTYDSVQSVCEGRSDEEQLNLPAGTLDHLFAVYKCRKELRKKRGALELHLRERSIKLSTEMYPIDIEIREQKQANELIEELMILANICAAETLEQKKRTCVYRVHEPPSSDKLEELILLADEMNIKLPEKANFTPQQFNLLLEKGTTPSNKELLQNAILRCQSRANYSTKNVGHYGLGLQRYTHFTSPIRRYSDLLVHRALIAACNFGPNVISRDSEGTITEICSHISETEQLAAKAERRAINRMANIVLSNLLGTEQQAIIIGITVSGLFVSIANGLAEGFISRKSLPDDFYLLDKKKTQLTGKYTGRRFRLGDSLQALVSEISIVSGNISLSWIAGGFIDNSASKKKRKKVSNRKKSILKKGKTTISSG